MEKNRQADWLAWSLHYLLGLVVGAILCAAGAARRQSNTWLPAHIFLPFVIGGSLIGAGLASLLGDRLWMGSHYKGFPPEGPRHSLFSKSLSFLSLGIGAILAASVLVARFTHNA